MIDSKLTTTDSTTNNALELDLRTLIPESPLPLNLDSFIENLRILIKHKPKELTKLTTRFVIPASEIQSLLISLKKALAQQPMLIDISSPIKVDMFDGYLCIHGRGEGLGGFRLPPRIRARLGASAKFWRKTFLSDFQTCLRHFSESCPTQIFGAAHVCIWPKNHEKFAENYGILIICWGSDRFCWV